MIVLLPPPAIVVILLLLANGTPPTTAQISISPPPPDVTSACTSYVTVYTPAFANVITIPVDVMPLFSVVFGNDIGTAELIEGLVCVVEL
jgi:hypothetical protein